MLKKLFTDQFREDTKEVAVVLAIKTGEVVGAAIIETAGFVLNTIDKIRGLGK